MERNRIAEIAYIAIAILVQGWSFSANKYTLKTHDPDHTPRKHTVKKNAQITMPAQITFVITNWNNQHLLGSPDLYERGGFDEPFEHFKINEFTDTFTPFCSTDTRRNEHGQIHSYNTTSQELIFKSSHAEYRFNLHKFGNQVTYSTNSPGASVSSATWIFDDFPYNIYLDMLEPGKKSERKAVNADRRSESQIKGQFTQYSPNDPVRPAPPKKASQTVIRTTDKFSFLFNINLYFSGCDVYQEYPPGEIRKVTRSMAASTNYYLTADKSYPPGVTTLTIKDGFSEATAVVTFNHDTSKKQVTITIESYTSRLCDIRNFEHWGVAFPNAICFAL